MDQKRMDKGYFSIIYGWSIFGAVPLASRGRQWLEAKFSLHSLNYSQLASKKLANNF